jgi:hypothetical protein
LKIRPTPLLYNVPHLANIYIYYIKSTQEKNYADGNKKHLKLKYVVGGKKTNSRETETPFQLQTFADN